MHTATILREKTCDDAVGIVFSHSTTSNFILLNLVVNVFIRNV